MGRKLVAGILCVVVASMVAAPSAYAGDPTLIGWWKLNDGTGAVALDSSGYGNNGTVVNPNGGLGTGGSVWVDDPERGMVISFNGTDGSGACVTTPVRLPAMTMESDFTWVFWAKQPAAQATNNDTILGNRYGGTASPLQFIKFTPTRFENYNDDGSYVNGINYTSIPADVWIHHVVVKDGASLTYYRNGAVLLTNTMTKTLDPNPFYMGADGNSGVQEAWQGYLSDVRLYGRALTESEVLKAMAGQGPDAELAGDPIPEDEATDVPRDVQLGWTAGEFAATHNVYLGTSFDDVNGASATDPRGVLVSQDQAGTSYTPDEPLEYGQTYYWRVDEVNTAPDSTIFKGNVWSFTPEPYAYPITNLTVEASSAQSASPANRTIDRSGLDEFDQHSVNLKDMWVTPGGLPASIQYTFDKVYKVDELWVWNANSELETLMGFGAMDVVIEYSTDGETWAQLENVPQFARGTGKATYTANTIVDFGEVMAQYVKLTINDNWGATTMVSLSEVRFFYTPVQAFQPDPADGATQVSVDTELAWRPGRQVTSHQVYLGTDANAVAEGTATPETVTGHSYAPGSMDVATVYYWKVDEVGDTGAYEGDVWSFSTEDSIPIDDFESYTDDQTTGGAIFQAWSDGYEDDNNGSLVGYIDPPFAEQTVVYSGKQSMPLAYDNTGAAYSEATLSFDPAQDWTKHGVQTLSLYFFGNAANTGAGKLYVKINSTKVPYGGSSDDLKIAIWQPFTIDLASTGANLKKVTTLTIGVEGSGSTGALFIDEIRLYPTASATVTPVDPGTAGLVAYYKFDGDAKDSAGSHHGTATGSPGYVAGKTGQALNMTADAQYVEVAYAADLAMSTFTVAAWINVADLSALRAILGTRIGGDYTFDVKADSTRIHGDIGDGAAWLNTGLDISTAQGGIIGIGEWHHVAYVIDNAAQACYMYLDGALGSTATFSGTPMFMTSAETLGIGYCSSGEYMHGQIDEVRIYNRALSEAEVASLAGRTGKIYVAP
ncbi:MAG: LamG domain-containing protein [Phycisphaerales bacterium]